MPDYSYTDDRKWTMRDVSTVPANVPASPGIYVFGYVKSISGLECEREYVYIGRSKNVLRRIKEHTPQTEPKRNLREWLRENIDFARYWYLTGMTESEAIELEGELIGKFSPRFNDQLNPNKGGNS